MTAEKTPREEAQEYANKGRKNPKDTQKDQNREKVVGNTTGAAPTPVNEEIKVDEHTSSTDKETVHTDSDRTTEVSENNSDNQTTTVSELDSLLHLQTPDQVRQSDDKSKEKNTAEIKKHEDLDDIYDKDDDKFDIQQGDFIDFLMKDVVLAFAAYCGKKISTPLGVAAYQLGSKLYHGAKDNLWDPAAAEIGEAWDRFKGNVAEACRSVGAYEVKDKFKEDDETSKFGNTVLNQHNSTIKFYSQNVFGNDDGKMPDSSVFDHFAEAIMKGEVSFTLPVKEGQVYFCEDIANGQQQPRSDLYWFDPKNKLNVPIGSLMMQQAIAVAVEATKQANEKITDETKKKEIKAKLVKNFSKVAKSFAEVEAPERIFIQNMVTARQLHDRALTNENPDKATLDLYAAEAQKIYLAEYIKILKGESKYKNLQQLLDASYKPVETAHKNIIKGRYVEKGVDPQTIKNEPLDKLLTQNAEKIRTTDAKTLREEVMNNVMNDEKNKKAMENMKNIISALENDNQEVDKRRKRCEDIKNKKNKDNNNNNNNDKGNNGRPNSNQGR